MLTIADVNYRAVYGEFLRGVRDDLGLSLRAVAQSVGMDPGNYSRIETGVKPPPGAAILASIGEALGITPGTARHREMMRAAAVSRGEIPMTLLESQDTLPALVSLFELLEESPEDRREFAAWVESRRLDE